MTRRRTMTSSSCSLLPHSASRRFRGRLFLLGIHLWTVSGFSSPTTAHTAFVSTPLSGTTLPALSALPPRSTNHGGHKALFRYSNSSSNSHSHSHSHPSRSTRSSSAIMMATSSSLSSAKIRRRSPLHPQRRALTLLTTTAQGMSEDVVDANNDNNSNGNGKRLSPLQRAVAKFQTRPATYLLIPCVAAVVGWFTNWLAVQMIFYPVAFTGIPIWVRPEVPLGLIGWQGIVPCKTRTMSLAMVDMVSTQLLTVQEVFQRLDPHQLAKLLAPTLPDVTLPLLQETLPTWMGKAATNIFSRSWSQGILLRGNTHFVTGLVKTLQANIDQVFSLQNCVVNQMLQDRTLLGQLFQKCGHAELDFLTNSGLWFGFLLGLIQMVVALFWDNPWSLSIGGGIVGLATNWLALKWIFEPVDPVKIGTWILQGKFLRRQPEVAAEFSSFFANNILKSEQVWKSVLTDPTTRPAFGALFAQQFQKLVGGATAIFGGVRMDSTVLAAATETAMNKLPEHLPAVYAYMDSTLGLEETLRVRMLKMTSRQFERVLHPIFEEDELTLILAGAVLGFAAGLVQQGLETGRIQIPNLWKPFRKAMTNLALNPKEQTRFYIQQLQLAAQTLRQRIRYRLENPFKQGPNGVNGSGGAKTVGGPAAATATTTEPASTDDNMDDAADTTEAESIDTDDADETNDNPDEPEPI